MQNGYEFNSLEFIVAGGAVSVAVAVILLVMSIASWYLIVTKGVQVWRRRNAIAAYTQKFWSAPSLAAAIKQDGANAIASLPLANLAKQSIAAAEHYQHYTNKHAIEPGDQATISKDEFIARAMNRSIAEESARLEGGLTVLASVGSVSPFVGLFGTVWGIYHALASISQSGQATLDKVAGPVGEALIMT
ncbi:MAG: MotA/TolQ/ExbB proton channel family protein, partial [Pseudomonadota bacterium]